MYDYVIVGAGSAGCVLAARLTEDPDVRVCLIEAGGQDDADAIRVPAAFGTLFRTRFDWDYTSQEEPRLHGRRLFSPRGKGLGGTSSINSMLYVRGTPADYDAWGQPGWRYAELLDYFLRSEDNERGASEYHGVGGPLRVCDGRARNPSSAAFVEAALAAGYRANDDFNGAQREGFGFFQVTQRDGMRCSAADAFLRPAMQRRNLEVLTHVQAHRVLIRHGKAVGVTGSRLDEEITVRAEREVILCAGAYNSPQLLMLSGIGSADLLRALDVPVMVDLPAVGQNLQDHVLVPLNYLHSEPISMLSANTPRNLEQLLGSGTGPLTSNGPEAGGYLRTAAHLDGPDVAYLAAPVMFTESGLGMPTDHALSCGPLLLTPLSRGEVTIASADPTAKPKIANNVFAAEEDLGTAVAATRIAMDIATQEPMARYAEELHNAPPSTSTSDLREYARRTAHTLFHPVGTCAMGDVVDAELRVAGIEGLRVADVSVMPTIGRGNPNATAYAIAEKAADLVRSSAGQMSARLVS